MAMADPMLTASLMTWPEHWSAYMSASVFDTEYPSGRGAASAGWCCPGCGRCYSPFVAACWTCPGPALVNATATGRLNPEAVPPDFDDPDYER
jgi:hypothetical protein